MSSDDLRPQVDAATLEETQAAEDFVLRGDQTAEDFVLRYPHADKVDLPVHTRLVALHEALLGQTAMRELTVKSTELKTLPESPGQAGWARGAKREKQKFDLQVSFTSAASVAWG